MGTPIISLRLVSSCFSLILEACIEKQDLHYFTYSIILELTISLAFLSVPGGAPGANGGNDSAVGGGGKRLGPGNAGAAPVTGVCVLEGRGISSICTLWACLTLS